MPIIRKHHWWAYLIFLLTFAAGTAQARMITDMTGRKVNVPERITRVYGSSPPATYLLYAMDPSMIVGVKNPRPKDAALKAPPTGGHSSFTNILTDSLRGPLKP